MCLGANENNDVGMREDNFWNSALKEVTGLESST